MSDEKSQQQEPTMEEILASIRRIISENDEGEAKGEAAPQTVPEEEIFELTDVVEEGDPSAAQAQEPGEVAETGPEAAQSADDFVVEDAPGTPAPQGDAAQEPSPQAGRMAEDSLVSDATAEASIAALGQLARALDRDPRTVGNTALGAGNTLEDLVKDMIRPMLKEWLDQNLASLVDRLVRREIERMVHRAEDDV